MTLDELHVWASLWGVSPLAVTDLMERMTAAPAPELPLTGHSEAAVQAIIRLRMAQAGGRGWRNNVGALLDSRGVPVRYGLANDSAQVNAAIKSADVIGIKPVRIGPEHVGQVIGQFWSRECKAVGWQWRGDAHEKAQLAWAQLVLGLGGDAGFTTGAL
jgi:hypothetical protein